MVGVFIIFKKVYSILGYLLLYINEEEGGNMLLMNIGYEK